ncbi:hypothetical protein OOU_Y34scaffold00370g40 [Pyricularia oryzae Y34]|uniref:Uncharacterized protein n=1 Tax=Pyricularia oryzae (strain Y34) TaxID=1143189 RepID=A0AA97P264_PYRO3|nr:hypothetical protein OOU_Y34scaffold00370g40 [Pyricularia oryzae Y34]
MYDVPHWLLGANPGPSSIMQAFVLVMCF